jgi:chloramphenicol-sensitive protein RarD
MNNIERKNQQGMKAGIGYAILAYVTWGVLPLYWKLMESISSIEILAQRIFWSFIFVAVLLTILRRWSNVKSVLTHKKTMLSALFCSFLISGNWFIYIWAVNHGHVIEASLGYYINPLISILLGIVVLRERLAFWQVVSLVLAAVGVFILTVEYGKIPWIAFSLALSFAFYGLAKKQQANVDALTGLTLETVLSAPFAFVYLLMLEANGTGGFGTSSWGILLLFIGSGVVTAMPLLWFARSTKMVPLSTIGFIQYLAPTISLLLGIIVFKESFTLVHAISFAFIWCSLVLYSLSYMPFMQDLQARFSRKNYSPMNEKKHFQ